MIKEILKSLRPKEPAIKEVKHPFHFAWEELKKKINLEENWVKTEIRYGNSRCLSLLEKPNQRLFPNLKPVNLENIGLENQNEWQIFYLLLLESFVKTNEDLEEVDYREVLRVLLPVKRNFIKSLTSIPEDKKTDWVFSIGNAARIIVLLQNEKGLSYEERCEKITNQAKQYGERLKLIKNS